MRDARMSAQGRFCLFAISSLLRGEFIVAARAALLFRHTRFPAPVASIVLPRPVLQREQPRCVRG